MKNEFKTFVLAVVVVVMCRAVFSFESTVIGVLAFLYYRTLNN